VPDEGASGAHRPDRLIVTLGTLMTVAWIFVLGIFAVGLIDEIFS